MDTTVILAHARVSRLRADVIYVDSWGMAGHGRAWLGAAEIDVHPSTRLARRPPKNRLKLALTCLLFSEKVRIYPLYSIRIWPLRSMSCLICFSIPNARWGAHVLHCCCPHVGTLIGPKCATCAKMAPRPLPAHSFIKK